MNWTCEVAANLYRKARCRPKVSRGLRVTDLAAVLLGVAFTVQAVADDALSLSIDAGVPDPALIKVREGDTAVLPLVRDARQLAAVVGGIISYTRWPQSPPAVRLCVLGHGGLVEQVQASTTSSGQRALVAQAVRLDANYQRDCDAVYVTAMPPENARIVLRQVVGSPILTVGEGAEFCSDGGMFCLDDGTRAMPGNPRARFSANLDAIARSGLRVNPQVLLLARVPKVSPP